MNITHKWERFMAIGCSHGHLIDPNAKAAVLDFAERFKPVRRFHLGDWCDTAALRLGAKGSSDESEPITPDIDEGLQFLDEYGCTDCTMGNHDERPYRFLHHPNAMVKTMAELIVYGGKKNGRPANGGIEGAMKRMKINWVNSWDLRNYIYAYGIKWMHGYMYGQNCARDHAEAHGNVCFAHAHTAVQQQGRRDDNPFGICVGTLARIAAMEYAKNRRQTHAWSAAIAYGEGYANKLGWIQLYNNGQNKKWNLPV